MLLGYLGRSDDADIASKKDEMLGEAVEAERRGGGST